MSGSRLGRGRGGRLAVYGACSAVVLLLVFLYRAATTEMSRLREIHTQCVHQQEALAAQLQVIFEYKVRLEKSLAEEKSSNAAVKQELQQRASHEKSLRDKDSVEALRRFNSLQQSNKILQTENQDLKEDCEKQQKQALEDRKRLEATLSELRSQLREAREDKEKSLEHLKTKFLEIDIEKTRLEDKYNALLKSNGNTDSTIEHLRKEIMQLNRELKEAEHSCKATSSGPSMVSHRSDHQLAQPNVANGVGQGVSVDDQQRSSSQQQVSRPSNDVYAIPHPIEAPRDHQPIRNTGEDNKTDESAATEKPSISDVGFVRHGDNIVPAGSEELEGGQKDTLKNVIPLPYALKDDKIDNARRIEANKRNEAKMENVGDAPPKPVLATPDSRNMASSSSSTIKSREKKASSNVSIVPRPKVKKSDGAENTQMRPEERQSEEKVVPSEFDEIRDIQKKILQNVPTNPKKIVSSVKIESSTKSGMNSGSTISAKLANPVAAAKPIAKFKIPSGVLPILNIIDTNVEANGKGGETKKIEEKNSGVKNHVNEDGKERGKIQAGNNVFPQVPGRQHMGEQILNGPDDAEWFRAKGIQEIGDDMGNDVKLHNFDEGQVRPGADGADYENYYNKGPQQKNPEESEDEGEEEDVADYMNNNEMKKPE